ncbi:MAG: hypothetical protein AYK22_08735 [Thermoplasmatales archaeon SG8-52-3]|nr:MAG: hypothetical protein AYK22_08735 [Thermoplasmatales archaeon SG8-52-3]
MYKKIVCILVMTLLITTAISVVGRTNVIKENVYKNNIQGTNEYNACSMHDIFIEWEEKYGGAIFFGI